MEVVLNSYGTYLTKKNGIFAIVNKDGEYYLDPSKIKTIIISKSAQISSDAAILAIENNIDVIFVDNTGNPIGRIWSNRFALYPKYDVINSTIYTRLKLLPL